MGQEVWRKQTPLGTRCLLALVRSETSSVEDLLLPKVVEITAEFREILGHNPHGGHL